MQPKVLVRDTSFGVNNLKIKACYIAEGPRSNLDTNGIMNSREINTAFTIYTGVSSLSLPYKGILSSVALPNPPHSRPGCWARNQTRVTKRGAWVINKMKNLLDYFFKRKPVNKKIGFWLHKNITIPQQLLA